MMALPAYASVILPLGAGIVGGLLIWGADTEVQAYLNGTAGKIVTPVVGGVAIAGVVYYLFSN